METKHRKLEWKAHSALVRWVRGGNEDTLINLREAFSLMGRRLVQICYGSRKEVQRFEEYVYGSSPRFAEEEAEQLNPKA